MPETITSEKATDHRPDTLNDLEQTYGIEDRAAVSRFITENRLGGLLLEARTPLAAAFGSRATRVLRLVSDGDGSTTLFCLVAMPGSVERALEARAIFDRTWWLDRCSAAGGKLNFDFELT
jgi:hypothetical protein